MASRSGVLLFAILALNINYVLACSCLRGDTFTRTYFRSLTAGTPFTLVKVISKQTRKAKPTGPFPAFGNEVVFKLKVLKISDGCTPRLPYTTFAVTADNSAACGVNLQIGALYIIPLKKGANIENRIGLCGFQTLLKNVNKEQRKFMLNRTLCCGDRCKCSNGKPFVNCLVDPCSVSKPPCKEAKKCVSNFCGGCNAEWFDSKGLPACEPGALPYRR